MPGSGDDDGGGPIILTKSRAQKTMDLVVAGLGSATPDPDVQKVLDDLQAILDTP